MTLYEMEDLDIEREAVDVRRREDQPGDVRSKCLQPTLGIAVLTEQQCMCREVDESPADLANTAGTHERRGRDVTPVPDDHIPSVLDLREQRQDLCGRV